MKAKLSALFLSVVLLITSLGLFAGCSSANGLRVINFRVEDQAYYSWLANEFEKETGIRVMYEAVGTDGYSNLLNSRLQADAVDVFGSSHSYVGNEELRTKMLDLSDLKGGDGKNLWENVTDASKQEIVWDGKYYVAPLNEVSMLVYYNKDIMNEETLGIDFANGEYPTTWNEFERTMAAAKALANKNQIDGVFCYGGAESWPISMIVSAVEGNTVRAEQEDFYLDMAKSTDGYTFAHPYYHDFFEKLQGICEFIDPLSCGTSYTRAPSNFATKKYAMMIDGSWSYATVKTANPDINLGFFPIPVNDEAEKNTKTTGKGGAGFCINKKTTKVEESKRFIEFMYRPDVYQRYIDSVCSLPSIKGYELTDPIAKQMFSFETRLTMENMWIPALQGTEWFRDIAINFINGKMSVTQAENQMNKSLLVDDKEKWQDPKTLNPWFDKWYPGERRADG